MHQVIRSSLAEAAKTRLATEKLRLAELNHNANCNQTQRSYGVPGDVFAHVFDAFFQSKTSTFLKPYSKLMAVRGRHHYA